MFNKSMATLTSSPLLLESSVAFYQYEFFIPFFLVAMNTSLGPNFPTITTRFSGQILHTLNPTFIVSFFKDSNKALSTHVANVTLSSSRQLFHAIVGYLYFFKAFLKGLKQVTSSVCNPCEICESKVTMSNPSYVAYSNACIVACDPCPLKIKRCMFS